jgi:arylsulfatase A-like enzyme
MNIVLILADDLGYGDLGLDGQRVGDAIGLAVADLLEDDLARGHVRLLVAFARRTHPTVHTCSCQREITCNPVAEDVK